MNSAYPEKTYNQTETSRPASREAAPGQLPETAIAKTEARPLEKGGVAPDSLADKARELFSLKRRPKKTIPISPQSATTKQVEKILEAGLGEAYSRLSPVAQQEFKLHGEETARAIAELLKTAHVKVKKIFRLILGWLKMLPGLNRFFLEQEAKIKTDKIIALHQNKK